MTNIYILNNQIISAPTISDTPYYKIYNISNNKLYSPRKPLMTFEWQDLIVKDGVSFITQRNTYTLKTEYISLSDFRRTGSQRYPLCKIATNECLFVIESNGVQCKLILWGYADDEPLY